MLNHLQATFLDTNPNTTPDNAEAMTSCLANHSTQKRMKLVDSMIDNQPNELVKEAAKIIALKKEPCYDFVGVAG
jgi:hypothetical protein